MEVTALITRLDLVRFNLWALFRLRANLVFMAVLVVGIFVYIAISKAPASPNSWAIAVVASLAGGVGGLLGGFVISLACILITSSEKAGVLGKHIYTISEQGFHEQTLSNETTQKWSGVQALNKSGQYILVRINSYLFHIIPKRAFSREEDFEDFWKRTNKYWKQAS